MVYGFATQANGTAMVESTAGAGTTVQLYLPRAPAEATLRKPTETELSTEAGPLRVLLVDDDPGVRELTQEMLKERGHLVVVADSGRAALDILQADAAFDLLLTDYAMPVMNGSQIATEVRLRWPSLPVLFMTGYVDNDALRPWAELGLPILNKPFRSEALATAIAQATAGTRTASNVVPLRVPS
jgi:CheY-like chemotaxis protein